MSSYGESDVLYGSHSGGGHSSCPAGIPVEFALLSILAAFGVAFGVLYRALTLTTGMRRREADTEADIFMFADFLRDLTWAGLAEQLEINCWGEGLS